MSPRLPVSPEQRSDVVLTASSTLPRAEPPAPPPQLRGRAALELTAAFADAARDQQESCRPDGRKVGRSFTSFYLSIVTNQTFAFCTEGK